MGWEREARESGLSELWVECVQRERDGKAEASCQMGAYGAEVGDETRRQVRRLGDDVHQPLETSSEKWGGITWGWHQGQGHGAWLVSIPTVPWKHRVGAEIVGERTDSSEWGLRGTRPGRRAGQCRDVSVAASVMRMVP